MKIMRDNGKIWVRPTTESEKEIYDRLPVQKINVNGKQATVFTKESEFVSFMKHFEVISIDVYSLESVHAACKFLSGPASQMLKARAQRWSTADRSQLTEAGRNRIEWLKAGVMLNVLEKWANHEAELMGYGK